MITDCNLYSQAYVFINGYYTHPACVCLDFII